MAPRDALRDRTGEFRAIVERLQRQQVGTSDAGSGASSSGAVGALDAKGKGEFAKRASSIGMAIHSTSLKLQQLAKLAKRTSMFDDPTQQINELTAVIKQDIHDLNSNIAQLQTFSGKDAYGNKQSTEHSSSVVNNLKDRLMDTTKEFKDVLTNRTESLKVHESRQAMFSSPSKAAGGRGGPSRDMPWAGGMSSVSSQQLFKRPTANPLSAQPGETTQEQQQQNFAAQQQMQLVQQQDTYMASRSEALQNVESTITELGGIFQQLATMVQQQHEVAIRIDEDVDETIGNVDGAQQQLLKYLDRISTNRWLVMKIFFVLMFFMMIFVVFVA